MERSLIDRLDDTAVFKVLLFLSGATTVPLILLGLGTLTPTLLLGSIWESADGKSVAMGLLPVGGAIGVLGWLRAHWGVRQPAEHNVTLTLLCIAVGIATAMFVGGYVTFWILDTFAGDWGLFALAPAAFAAGHVVWILSGLAWAERLTSSYAEATGEAYDTIPTLLLAVAAALACTVAFIMITL
jgi:hypothetical protein